MSEQQQPAAPERREWTVTPCTVPFPYIEHFDIARPDSLGHEVLGAAFDEDTAYLFAGAARLRDALIGAASGHKTDGSGDGYCWCPRWWIASNHCAECEDARAALAASRPPAAEVQP